MAPPSERLWDQPRPPRLERETSHPPTYDLPRADILSTALVPAAGSSSCEWKDRAFVRLQQPVRLKHQGDQLKLSDEHHQRGAAYCDCR